MTQSSPSRSALLGFYAELERIAQERRHSHDQATVAIRADLKRGGLLKPRDKANAR